MSVHSFDFATCTCVASAVPNHHKASSILREGNCKVDNTQQIKHVVIICQLYSEFDLLHAFNLLVNLSTTADLLHVHAVDLSVMLTSVTSLCADHLRHHRLIYSCTMPRSTQNYFNTYHPGHHTASFDGYNKTIVMA